MATRRAPLRAVKPSERKTAPKAAAKSISDVAAGGDKRELLVALRTKVAKTLEDARTHPRDVPPLTRRLTEIVEAIEAIDSREGGDDIGDAAATPDEAFDSEAL